MNVATLEKITFILQIMASSMISFIVFIMMPLTYKLKTDQDVDFWVFVNKSKLFFATVFSVNIFMYFVQKISDPQATKWGVLCILSFIHIIVMQVFKYLQEKNRPNKNLVREF